MNPWTLVGWVVAIFLLIALTPAVVKIVYTLFLELPAALVKDFLDARRLRRANAGKATCQHYVGGAVDGPEICSRTATRRTPNGFYCEAHFNNHRNGEKKISTGSISYAFVLDWYKPEFDLKMRDRA